jgi:hypothetical protein
VKRSQIKKGTKQLKRSGFKKATRGSKLKSKKKTRQKGYQVPKWFTSIPLGSHGNNPTQKRYWKVTSDFVRQRDHRKYGKCVSCHKHMETWQEGDCGHYRAWSICNSWFKYDLTNLALQCKGCNRLSDGVVGHKFGETLKKRHGQHHLKWIEATNLQCRGMKMEKWEIVEKVEKLIEDNPWFVLP